MSSPLVVTISQTGVPGVQAAQISIAGQSFNAPITALGLGYTTAYATGLALDVQVFGSGVTGTFVAFGNSSTTGPATLSPFTGSPRIPNNASVTINNATPYSVMFVIVSNLISVSSPLPAIVNPGGSLSFNFNTGATPASPIVITGSAQSPSSPQPSNGGNFVPTNPPLTPLIPSNPPLTPLIPSNPPLTPLIPNNPPLTPLIPANPPLTPLIPAPPPKKWTTKNIIIAVAAFIGIFVTLGLIGSIFAPKANKKN